ncbi:MAG: FtsH protease activity modulator HflK [Pseudomonadota bacterium]
MPWDDTRGGKGGWGGQPPSLDEVLSKFHNLFKGGSRVVFWVFALIILGFWLFSCVYTVGVNEVGVIQCFGKYVRQTTSGLHFKLPSGIEKVTKVKVDYVYTEEFGLRTVRAGVRTEYASSKAFLEEALMLTGDLNCAVVPWIVQFRISDPVNFLFRVRDVQRTLRDLSEAVMRQVVGDRSINELINKREEIAVMAKAELQKVLDEAQTGISLKNVELKTTNVPEPVQPSFNEVNQAGQEKEQMIYKAKEEYNKAIPTARGEAEKIVRASEGYALDRINRAKGDANRFLALWEEYKKAEDVTRRRLYLEAIQEVLPKIKMKYIIDHEQKNLLPLLNLQRPEVKP